jgi:leader peptidase (prepilin peptidase)/N-methyltransferase
MDPFSILPPGFVVAFSAALGLIVGSFLNVVIHRLPRGESVVTPRSRCPGCGHQITALENVPVLSYLVLRGRCSGCGARISPRYPAIELLTGALFVGIALRYGIGPLTPLWWCFAAALVAAAAIDFDHRIIPDEISLGGLVVALVCVPALHAAAGQPLVAAAQHAALGALFGGGALWLVGFIHARVSAAAGRQFPHWPGEGEDLPRPGSIDYWTWFPGVGFGDVKLLAMIGAVLGPLGVLETILVASLAGLLFGVGWALATRRWNAPFGFGPAIAFGALFVLLAPYHLV